MHQADDPDVHLSGSGNNMISAYNSFSEESSDEDYFDGPVDWEECLCCVCGEHFPLLDQLMEHLKTHEDPVCCHLCTANFDRAVTLALHLKNAHPKYHLYCMVCHISFRSTWHLNEHLEKHNKEILFEEKEDVKPFVKFEETPNCITGKYVTRNSWDDIFFHDHSYCAPIHPSLTIESSRAENVIKEQIHSPSTSCFSSGTCSEDDLSLDLSSSPSEAHFDDEYVVREDIESMSAEDKYDTLPLGDTEHCPDEDLSSDLQCFSGSDMDNLKYSSRSYHQKKVKMKKIDSEMKASYIMNHESSTSGDKMDFQIDSRKDENVYNCEKKLSYVCCMCKAACKTKELLLKHIQQNHPTAVYICSNCLYVFTPQDAFHKHICRKEPTGQINILPASTEKQPPFVKLLNGDGQKTAPSPLSPKPVEIQMIPQSLTSGASLNSSNSQSLIPIINQTIGQTLTTPLQNIILAQTERMGNISPSGHMKLTELPLQTLVRPPGVSITSPNVSVCSPSIKRPALPNQRMTLRIPASLSPSLQTHNKVVVSFSRTASLSAPIPVSANSHKFIPTPRQTEHNTNIRPLQSVGTVQFPGNVRPNQMARYVRPVQLPRNVGPFEIFRSIKPFQCSGNVRPVQLSRNVGPTQISGNVQPVQNVRPVQLSGNVRPVQLSRNVGPTQIFGNVQPVQNVRPVQLSGNVRPVQLSRYVGPTQISGHFEPVQNVKPVQLSGNVRPVQFYENVGHSQISGNVQPVQNVPPFQLSWNVRPIQFTGNFKPFQLSGNVRPVQLSGNGGPPQLPGHIGPILLSANAPLSLASCNPTLVSAILQKNQPCTFPAQVQSPRPDPPHMVLQKQVKQAWRSKPLFPCRHCGAISRQPSLRVRHRYLHRGSRLYRCQCGRSFQRQIHLLRHQVQHAESVRFVCACCGRTFEGAHKLTRHKLETRVIHRRYAKIKCRMAFECTCGRVFARPSVLLWHVLKNTKPWKKTHNHIASK